MKQLLGGLILALAGACGGGSKPAATEPAPPPPSACATMAEHATAEIVAMERGMPLEQRPVVQRVLTERCEQDAWSDEVIACITRAKGEELETCGEMFSRDQETAIDRAIEEALQGDAKAEPADEEGRMGGKDRDDLEGGSGARRKDASPDGDGATDDPCGGGAQK